MRILPPLTALAVAAALYLAVFERDRFVPQGPDSAAPEAGVTATEPAALPEAGPVQSVVTLQSVAKPVQNAVLTRGRTEAARQVEVRSETSGLVLSEPLRRGAFVTQGQVLCQLAPGTRIAQRDEAAARVSEAQARLREAQLDADAANRLSEGGFASETQRVGAVASLEAALAGVQAAEAQLAATAAEIERLTIAAPFQGLLETDTAEIGALLQPGGACATVIQLDPIKIVGFVAETDVDRIAVGAVAGARFVSGREIAGRVTFLSRSSDPATRTFRVEVTVPNADLSIRDGLTAEILISAEGVMAHLLPASALTLDDAGDLGVQTVVDGRALFAPVTLLRDTVEGVLVTGLPPEVDVVVVGQEYVSTGVAVVATMQEASQ